MPAPRLRRIGGSRKVRLFAVSVAVAGLLVTADRVLALASADRLAERIVCATGLDGPLSVSVDGWPFADQLLTGRFRRLTVTATGLSRPAVKSVTAIATDVRVTDDGRLAAASVRADLIVDYRALARRVSGGNGVLAVRVAAAVAGRDVPVTVYARPVLAGDRLTVAPTEIEAFGVRVRPARFAGRLQALPERRLPALPEGLTYRSVRAEPDGLRLTVTGTRIVTRSGDTCGGDSEHS